MTDMEKYLTLAHRLRRAERQAMKMYQALWDSEGKGNHDVQADKVLRAVEQAVEALK
jgi:hypothetical protein